MNHYGQNPISLYTLKWQLHSHGSAIFDIYAHFVILFHMQFGHTSNQTATDYVL